MRIIIARCSVDCVGRLTAHLPMATRLIMIKADGTVLIHADRGRARPLSSLERYRPRHGQTGYLQPACEER